LPTPNASQYAEITKWFWRTSVSGYFSGWNTGMMTRDKAVVRDFVEGKVETIAVNAVHPAQNIWSTKVFRADGAHAKTLGIVLAHQRPVDLLTGQEIDVSKSLAWTNAKEYHHFFPRDFLKTNGVDGSHSNRLANIVMLSSASNKTISNRAPSDYLKDVHLAAGSELQQWLDSNLISELAFTAALEDDYEAFLEARCHTIDAVVRKLSDWPQS
jgi:hypothetical protein